MDKPEALRLAEILEQDPRSKAHHDEAAAELRRFQAENERLHQANEAFSKRQFRRIEKMFALETQRDVLLKALSAARCAAEGAAAQRDALLEALKYHQEQTRPIQRTLDVIKAVEEGK